MTKLEVKDRSVIQKSRMDEAIKKVESEMHEARGVFSKRLNAILNESDYGTRRQLAYDIGAVPSTITGWESFTPKNFHKLRELCKCLDLDANYLLGLSDENKSLSETFAEDTIIDTCKHCGCTELLCGEGGPGCTSAKANQ